MIIFAKILSILFIIILCIIGLLSLVTLATSTRPLEYTITNTLDCPPSTTCKHDPDSDITVPTEEYFNMNSDKVDKNGYSNAVSLFCMELINRAYLDDKAEDIKGVEFKDNFFSSDINDGKEFCNIFKSKDVLWIVFRGTEKIDEWINNLKMSQVSYETSSGIKNIPLFLNEENPAIMVHRGFIKLYSDIRSKILENVSNFPEVSKICVCGHSLGGALATITAFDLTKLGYTNTILYSYASPRVGNDEFKKQIESSLKHFRIFNTVDIIPQMPLPISPNTSQYDDPYFYEHNGMEYSFEKYMKSILNNHSIITYIKNNDKINYIDR